MYSFNFSHTPTDQVKLHPHVPDEAKHQLVSSASTLALVQCESQLLNDVPGGGTVYIIYTYIYIYTPHFYLYIYIYIYIYIKYVCIYIYICIVHLQYTVYVFTYSISYCRQSMACPPQDNFEIHQRHAAQEDGPGNRHGDTNIAMFICSYLQ